MKNELRVSAIILTICGVMATPASLYSGGNSRVGTKQEVPTIGDKGYLIIEAESTGSELGNWIVIEEGQENYVGGASGKAHIEFQGNAKEGGAPDSPLEYSFRAEAKGNYALLMQSSKRLEGARDDMCNDAYIRMSGDFESANDLDASHLRSYMKFFQEGGEIDNCWLWSAQVTDAHHNFTYPTYQLKPDEIYTLSLAGRSKRYNIDYIVLYDTRVFSLEEIKKELEQLHPKRKSCTAAKPAFQASKDLLLAQFDSKTDVDDLHSVAALATILASPDHKGINYHAVAGAYGIQGGLYVPANELFSAAFGTSWSDAHSDPQKAKAEVKSKVSRVLAKGGRIWIAEAGQSDFTAACLEELIREHPDVDIKSRVHLVQHGAWNEKQTSPEKLQFVRQHTSYHKIPDGNAAGNGTAGYRSVNGSDHVSALSDPRLIRIWELARTLCEQYNGKDGRYLNEAIAGGGFDFSDISEVSWILDIQHANNVDQFFEVFGQ